ncbi:MAG: hypothetical protein WCJ30_03705 [Deltaproteobacteria bacterium]
MAIKGLLAQGFVVAALGLGALACGGPLRYTPHGTARAPEADAQLEVTVNSAQRNSQVRLRMTHLAPPDRLAPGLNSYVVWSRRATSSPWNRIGTLVYNADTREGELNTMAPETPPFEINVTAESTSDASPAPASPSLVVVLVQRAAD